MLRLRVAVLSAIAIAFLSIGCANKSPSDNALATEIKAKLFSNATTKPANLNVAVKDGVVTLSGDVPSSDVELEAMKVANGTNGVRSVTDQIKVNPALAGNQLPDAGNPQPPNNTPAPNNSTANQSAAPAPQNATSNPAPPPPPPAPAAEPAEAPKPVTVTVPAGHRVSVRTIDAIDSAHAQEGQTFRATLSSPIVHNGRTVVPAGQPVTLTLTGAKSAGRIKGSAEIAVRLTSLEYRGRRYEIDSTVYSAQGKGRGKQTAVRTGIGAAAGAIIGAIAGGGKGAAIGSAAGGGAGLGYQIFTHGQQVKIPSETILTFQLNAPLTIHKGV